MRPLSDRCLTKSIIYQATVKSNDGEQDQTYIGLTENTFKTWHGNHKTSFKHESKQQHRTQQIHMATEEKECTILYHMENIVKQARAYSNTTNKCNLCNWEKYVIVCKPAMSTLNKRSKLVTACRHSSKFLLMKFNT